MLAQPRKDLSRRRTGGSRRWRATPRPRSLTVGADRRQAVYIEDAETSDVWLLDLESRGRRAPDHRPRPGAVLGGRRAAPLARRRDGRLRGRGPRLARARGRRAAAQAGRGVEPGLGSGRRRLVIERRARRHDAARRGRRGRRLAAAARRPSTATSTSTATRATPPSRPTATEVAYMFSPRGDLNRSEIRVAVARRRRGARAHRHARDARPTRRPGLRTGTTLAYAVRAQRLLRAAPRRPRRRRASASSPSADADHSEAEWHPDGDAARRGARPAQPLRPRVGGRRRRSGRAAGRGRHLELPALDRRGRRSWRPTRTTPPPRELRRSTPGAASRTIHAPAPRAGPRGAPRRARGRDASAPSTGSRSPASSCARATPRRAGPCRRWSTRTAGPPTPTRDDWDGHAQYFVDKGYAWLAVNFRGSTGLRPRLRARQPRRSGAWATRRTASPRRTSCARSTGSTASGSASSARATAPTWRCSR